MNQRPLEDLRIAFELWGSFQKSGESAVERISRTIEIRNESKVIGYLIPFSMNQENDPEAMSQLMNWRNSHKYAYPNQFTATMESTKKWFTEQVINNPARVLFWVTDENLYTIGHLGLTFRTEILGLEIDNVLRGKPSTPGLMAEAIHAIEGVAEEEFSVSSLSLRVLESNAHAVDFYTHLNYKKSKSDSLISHTEGDRTVLTPGEPASDYFLTMEKSLLNIRPIPELILTAGPSISSLERVLVSDAVQNGWNSHHSDYIKSFEDEFAELIGVKFAMATSSCTGALHLALVSLGIGAGDEVIVPEVTWVATASAVSYVGATPVFADIDPTDWTISLSSIEKLITKRTKAIVPVHLYGYGANMSGIQRIAEAYGLKVIEDAAPAIGAKIDGKYAGTFGDFGCFSFQGAKLLVTGEGGMLVTNNADYFARAKKIQDHGRKPGTFWIEEIGHKYKMNNITAALGLGQVRRSENQVFRKRRINSWYKEELSNLSGIRFQEERPGTSSICWMTSIEFSDDLALDQEKIITFLKGNGVDSRPVFPTISQYPIWGKVQEPQPIANRIAKNSINLPSGVMLSHASVLKVTSLLRKLIQE